MESSQTLSIDKYWQIIKRRWVPGTTVLLTVFILGVVATLTKKPIYEAQSQLRFKKSNASANLNELSREIGTLSPIGDESNPLNTEAEIIRSVPLVKKTIADLNLKNEEGKTISTSSFRDKLQVAEITETDIVRVAYQDHNPKLAAQVVNTLVANYLDRNIMVNRAEAVAAREFLEKQLPKTEQSLRKIEAEIRKIKEDNQITSTKGETAAIIENLKNIEQEIANAQGSIASSTSQAEYIKNKLGFSAEQALLATAISQSPKVQGTIDKLQAVESELAQERTRFTEDNPQIIALQAKRDSLQKLLRQQAESVGGSKIKALYQNPKFGDIQQQLAAELIQLEATKNGLAKQVDYLIQAERTQRERARQLPQLEQKLRQLERELNASQSTYESLLQQRQTIQIAENQNIGNVRVVSYAEVPQLPLSSRSVAFLASGSLALLAAAGIIYLLEITDKSIKTTEEAKQLLGYTWLGAIPDTERLKLMSLLEVNGDSTVPKLVVKDYPSLPVSESYRMLQSNLKFLSSDKQVKSIVVTSSVAGEGKSAITANLATAMAQVGHKVLLVDADLHRPLQHRIWDVYNGAGLSNVIAEQLDPRMAIEEVMPNLNLLPAGVLPPSPATLLDSQRMKMLISYWSERYDFVIIDTPAIDFAPDAPIIGRMADGILLAVKLGKVERVKANFTKEILEQSGQNVLGIVLNGVNTQTESRSYYYHALEGKQSSADSPRSTKLLEASDGKEELWETISRLATESEKNKFDFNLDRRQLYTIPIDELLSMVTYLQQDLSDLNHLVAEQEEELFVQRQKVKRLQRAVNLASDSDRSPLEAELIQEQERRRMLEQTLIGQRRNLEKRRQILTKYQEVLTVRQESFTV